MKLKTKTGYWFSDSFKEYFGEPEILPAKVPEFFTLEKEMNDFEILEEINNEYCRLEQIAGFLENPPEGADDDQINIFYVKVGGEVFAVSVSWNAGYREWRCGAYRLCDDRWSAGNRAFRNSTSETGTKALGTSDALTLALKVVQEAGYVVVKGEVV